MVSTCLSGRSLPGACAQNTKRTHGQDTSYRFPCFVTSRHQLGSLHTDLLWPRSAPFFALMWPAAALWTGAPPRTCGTIYNPSEQIFRQRDSSASISQEPRVRPWSWLLTPYRDKEESATGAKKTGPHWERDDGGGRTIRRDVMSYRGPAWLQTH